jgi:hypothetical protein
VKRCVAALAAAASIIAMSGCGETAVSYCTNMYSGPDGGTPPWAVHDQLFDDEASCEQWYDAARAAAGPD